MSLDWMPDDELVDRLARRIHQAYLDDQGGPAPDEHPARRPWDDLAGDLQAQNRNQARDNLVKLRAAGFDVVATEELRDGDTPVEVLPDELVEALAVDEHERWSRQKRAQGYRLGHERIDVGPDRRHPDLVPWEELDEPTRDKDRAPVARIPAVLAEAGLSVIESR